MKLIDTIEQAERVIESFSNDTEEFQLSVSARLQDPVGINMTIITDSILRKGWMPAGFEQHDGFRVYRYRKAL